MNSDYVSTAYALALFRDELAARGFDVDLIDRLCVVACEAEVERHGLAVTTTKVNDS